VTIDSIPTLVKQLYGIVNQLETMFPGQKFTPDGHLVGSIGEVLAAYHYGLELLDNSARTHDAKTTDNQFVQIKITQGEQIAIRSEPDYLIVLKLDKEGHAVEIYNGPGAMPWKMAGKMQSNGQRSIRLSRLRQMNDEVDDTDRISRIR